MRRHFSLWSFALLAAVGAAGQAACGSGGSQDNTGGTSGGGKGGAGGVNAGGDDSTGDFVTVGTMGTQGSSGTTQDFDVQPSDLQTITVSIGQAMPAVVYTASVNGSPINVAWSLDRGDAGTIPTDPASSATFTPKGTSGGMVTVIAGLNGKTVKRQIFIKLSGQQSGADPNIPAEQAQIPQSVPQLNTGGGVGGVGGEGLGGAVTDMPTLNALDNPTSDGKAEGLTLLYPYDKTVWPRGMLAPLLMWSWATADADAIKIELSTMSGSFSWKGTFGRPAILSQTGTAFIRHPIPQDIWDAATNSAGGLTPDGSPDKLTVSLTIAKAGKAYGPISETWVIAPARLSGVIYYNSYGTQLAQNSGGAVGGNKKFGGAVLSIHVGDTGPKLLAGASGGDAQCRVCHSVAANGSRLVVQRGDSYGTTSAYDLTPTSSVEHGIANGSQFPGVSPDGARALTQSGKLISLTDGALLPISGLNTVATDVGTPAFSPDGAAVAFNPGAGPGLQNPKQKLYVMNFDAATGAFSNPILVADNTGKPAENRPGWPAFFPDGKAVVFHQQTAPGADGNNDGALYTRRGAKAHLSWTGTTNAQSVIDLNQLNGKDAAGNSYLPKLSKPIALTCTADGTQVGGIDADHVNDAELNYEPTVNPIASGGYAWVVFTSRRMYGSVAAIPPFCSDPRGVDLIKNITTKKLWVAAIDVNAKPGTDGSHPAFYLPAQELLAGNSRGFWVLDPCKQDGQGCATGDQCCNGFCEPNGTGGALVCSNAPPDGQCSNTQEKCKGDGDCCSALDVCINGFCTQKAPK